MESKDHLGKRAHGTPGISEQLKCLIQVLIKWLISTLNSPGQRLFAHALSTFLKLAQELERPKLKIALHQVNLSEKLRNRKSG